MVCPECGSSQIVKNGLRVLSNGSETQILKCSDCGKKFSENYIRCQGQRGSANYALLEKAKKLDTATELKTVASDEIKGKLLEHHVKMKLQGYSDATIRLSRSTLKVLVDRGADLSQPETVKQVISEQDWSGNRKRNVINVYTQFLAYLCLKWEPPNYTITRKIPFIPTEQEIDDLIAGTPVVVATFLQLLKETAMRSGEAIKIPWKDVDLERRVIMCNEPEKGSNPRIFSDLSAKLLTMLNNLPRENGLLFGHTTLNSLKAMFSRSRKRLAFKLGNPRLNEIHFHTLRHWKATMLYHYTKDLLLVAEFLGHKDIENTRLYIQLEKNLFKNVPDDKFIIKAISTLEEAVQLGEVGFEPFMTVDGVQLMRKRK